MRRFPWISWQWRRRAAQLILLALFFWLFRRTESTGADQLAGGENLFFRLDPLAGAAAMIAARRWIAAFWPAAVVLVLTAIFGRFFCGWVCPLGTLLDYFHRLMRPVHRGLSQFSRPREGDRSMFSADRLSAQCVGSPKNGPVPNRGNSRGPTARGTAAVQYAVLIAVLTAAALACPLVGLVDPFSILMRGLTFWVDPTFYRGADAVLTLWHGHGGGGAVEPFLRKHVLPFGLTTFHWAGLSAAILAAIFALEFVAQRFWCRYVCPLGGLLGLVSRRPLVERTPSQACPSCGQCTTRCRMNAVDAAGFSPEKCTLCMDCVNFCPQGIVQFRWKRSSGGKRSTHSTRRVDLSRRSALAGIMVGAAVPGVAAVARMARPASIDPHLLRPPGADDEKTFLDLCIRCGECMKVCPTNVLQPAVFEAGVEGIFSPRLLPRFIYEKETGEYKDSCEYGCTLCGQVCPTGAIPRLTEEMKHRRPTGKAYFNHALCLPWAEQTPCIRCEEMCPVPDKAIKILRTVTVKGKDGVEVELQLPYVDRDLCVGCGNCESKCPLEGTAAVRVFRVDAPDPKTETLLKPGETPKK